MLLSAAIWLQFATEVCLGALPEVYIGYILHYIEFKERSKKLRPDLLAFGCRQYSQLPLVTAGLLLVLYC